MSVASQRDIGSYISPQIGNVPVASVAATLTGAAIDRQDYLSCVLTAVAGAATGSPTALTLDAKLQDSADGSTGWADITGAAITTIAAASTLGRVDVNLHGAARYIRVVSTVAFTGGTSPTLGVATVVDLGGAVSLPA